LFWILKITISGQNDGVQNHHRQHREFKQFAFCEFSNNFPQYFDLINEFYIELYQKLLKKSTIPIKIYKN